MLIRVVEAGWDASKLLLLLLWSWAKEEVPETRWLGGVSWVSRSINYTIHERRLRKPAPAPPTSSSVARMACRNISRIRSGLLLLCTLLQRKDSLECAGIKEEDADRQCHYRDIYYVVSGKVTCWRHCCRGCGRQQREMGVLEWQLCVALAVCHCVTSFVATSLEEDSMN